ncbi:ATP-binding protein [Klenkia sp. PcliD-1-E]|uniref:ATP-binding protein n=1 Tax=Klenkia sp. PcliD-1-E TaxID=2954492 RepID=UPI002097C60C|nr:ATP-binding protein [Klenkia sp. PcliD-1-E]MCO7219148.1 ATP-binding protein [Klenkia sp. PcliD-1-E]
MRTPVNNPFHPGSDVVPRVWAGRTLELQDWRGALRPRLMAGLPDRGRTILGEPGLGKSSLVRRIAAEAEGEGDWVTPQVRVPAGSDPFKLVATALLDLAHAAGLASRREKRIAELFGRVQAIAATGISVTLRDTSGPEPHTVLTELLIEIGRAAVDQRVVCLVHIDEIQNITDEKALSQLLIALGDALSHQFIVSTPGGVPMERSLPIAVYLTGLPEFEDRAGARKGATFARRFKTTILEAIDQDDLVLALQEFVAPGWEIAGTQGAMASVHMTQAAVAELVDLCRGEPFLFQLAGQQAWNAGSENLITETQVRAGWRAAHREAAAHVERILGRLPKRERQLIQAMAELAPQERTLTRIAKKAGFEKTTDAGPTSQRLDTVRGIVQRGKPYRFRHRAIEAYLTSDWPNLE